LYDPEYYPGDPIPAELVYAENPTLSDIPELYELTEVLLIIHAKGFYQRWLTDMIEWFAKGFYQRWLTDMIEWFDVQTFQMTGPDEFFIVAHQQELMVD
jgi:hypothetical protein